MWNYVKNKELTLQSEEEIVSEQKIMLELLADDMDCIYMNEHIVNLLLEVREILGQISRICWKQLIHICSCRNKSRNCLIWVAD